MSSKKKLLFVSILFIFLFTVLFGAISDYGSDNKNIKNIELVQSKLVQLTYLDGIITQLQKERGLSAIYYENKSKKYALALNIQRKKTDLFINNASKYINTKELTLKRQTAIGMINASKELRFKAFMNYTDLIKSLLLQSEILIHKTQNYNIKNSLLYYNHLNVMQETAGQLRALIGGIITTKTISKQEYNEIIILNRIFKEHYKSVKGNIQQELSFETESIKDAIFTIDTITSISSIDDAILKEIAMEPLKWFDIATSRVDTIRESIIKEISHINSVVSKSMNDAIAIQTRHLILWSIGSFIVIIFIILSFTLSKKLTAEQKLLQSYKDVIDNNPNSIVSKTDKFGHITYVNDTFCKVSKYDREELIGKSHNIVRHEDSPKEVFTQLWKTIQSGKTWNGIVKNRTKDGGIYWVDASISSIYDDKGKLVEYIAMRHNVTDMILQSEETERTQRELIYRMGESVESRSKESGNHVRRVAHYSKTLALLYGLSEEESETLFIASTMHDMGKIAIPDAILLKPGKLDKDEFSIMKTHSEIGYKLLSGSNLPILKMASTIAYEHHEHYNGNGYPLGIKDKGISIHAKIVAIVDVFDALVSDRVYKKAWKLEKVLDTLEKEAGQQFDPVLIELFLKNINMFMKIKVEFEDDLDY